MQLEAQGKTSEVVFIIVLNHVIACGFYLCGKMSYDEGLAVACCRKLDERNGACTRIIVYVPHTYTYICV